MKPSEAAEGNAEKCFANDTEAGRNAGRNVVGAASEASPGEQATGQGTRLIEQMIDSANLNLAWKKVAANEGSAGVDGLSIEGRGSTLGKMIALDLLPLRWTASCQNTREKRAPRFPVIQERSF